MQKHKRQEHYSWLQISDTFLWLFRKRYNVWSRQTKRRSTGQVLSICIFFKEGSDPGWQKLHGSTGGIRRKVWTRAKNFKPEHTLFCRELRFVAIYALFGELWAKKEPFWVKNSVSWARSALIHGIYCIFHWVNFANLRLRAKTTHLTQNF